KVGLTTDVKYNVARIHQHMRGAVLAPDAQAVQREADLMNGLRTTNKGLLETFDKLINVPQARVIFDKIIAARSRDLEGQRELLGLLAAGDKAGAAALLNGRIAENERAYVQLLTEMVELQKGKMSEESDAIRSEFKEAKALLLGLSAAAVLIATLAAWYATRSITVPLNHAVRVAREVAAGNLATQVQVVSKDETGELMHALMDMNRALSGIVADVRVVSDTIATTTSQIAAGNIDLSSRTEQQASSLQQTAASMEQITGTVRQNADNARQANALASSASELAMKGGQVVSQVVETMGSISTSAKRIADITAVIDSIAFQTNILALNAAVEAARAGEQGRGFAVVASEVRSLAQRSAEAAREVKSLIADSAQQVESGTHLVDQAGRTMQDVVSSVKRVSDIIGEISAAVQEQTQGIGQINEAIGQMDGMTQRNAALVEEAAGAAQSLSQQAGSLVQAVSVFKLRAPAAA
ncbi:MAG TPA: methyl-accepting chemotaxis protein, partial [Burkholderiaceae bacterium]|nr:methyl-accepting chemotaxis protein [Burkholderiaceae bacterium]